MNSPSISRESAELLCEVLGQVNLNVGEPNFVVLASQFAQAKQELLAVIGEHTAQGSAADEVTERQPQ